jgi:hypothetical protein
VGVDQAGQQRELAEIHVAGRVQGLPVAGHGRDDRPADQRLWVLDLSQSVDDTAWSTSWHGAFYADSTSDDTVDEIQGSFWPGTAFVAVTPCDANNAPATCPAPGFPANYLGHLNMYNGQIVPVSVRGAALNPQGMIFVRF